MENSIKEEIDSYKIYLIEDEIKKLKREREKYYEPSILAMAKVKPKRKNEDTSFTNVKSFVKKLKNK